MRIGWSVLYLALYLSWVFGRPRGLAQLIPVPALMRHISAEVHPFVPYLILINLAVDTWQEPIGGRLANFATNGICLAAWFVDLGDDDDRWKRRRKRLAGLVKSVGHRLVVSS